MSKPARKQRLPSSPPPLRVVEPAEVLAAVELSRRVYCACGCSGLMHRNASGTGGCLLHESCSEFREATNAGAAR